MALLLFGLLPLARLNDITDFVVNAKTGVQAKFKSKEKIEQEILENKEPITKQNFIRFQNIESRILAKQQEKYGGKIKTLVHFMYGQFDKPQFMYTPDGSLQTAEALYFFEIKYIIKPEFAKNIVENAVRHLKTVYDTISPSVGKKLIIKLILTSGYNIDIESFDVPGGIEIEFVKI